MGWEEVVVHAGEVTAAAGRCGGLELCVARHWEGTVWVFVGWRPASRSYAATIPRGTNSRHYILHFSDHKFQYIGSISLQKIYSIIQAVP